MNSKGMISAAWTAIEYLAFPVLMFLATPILIESLGAASFGLWMLVASIVGSWGLSNIGTATMITRYVAKHSGQDDLQTAIEIIRVGLGGALIGGGVTFLILKNFSDWFASVFFREMGVHLAVVDAIESGALLQLLAQIEYTYRSAIKGLENYGIAARVELFSKTLLVLISIYLAKNGHELKDIFFMMQLFAVINIIIYGYVLSLKLGNSIWIPKIASLGKETVAFAGWSWLQICSGTFFHQFDRFIVGAMLGAEPLAAYSACLQIAQQIHSLPAALFSFLLSRSSRIRFNRYQNRKYIALGIIAGLFLGIPIIIFANNILKIWMGESFAEKYGIILIILAGGYLLLAFNVVPHFLNLSMGNARLISILNLIGGIATIIICALSLSDFGLLGVAYSKYFYGCILLIGYFKIEWMKKNDCTKN